jgi:hypothetical protein
MSGGTKARENGIKLGNGFKPENSNHKAIFK